MKMSHCVEIKKKGKWSFDFMKIIRVEVMTWKECISKLLRAMPFHVLCSLSIINNGDSVFTVKNGNFARFAPAFFIFVHFRSRPILEVK